MDRNIEAFKKMDSNEAIELLFKDNCDLTQIIDKAVELKHNWQSIKENAMIVFENNSLIEFMNNLENILKGDDTNE